MSPCTVCVARQTAGPPPPPTRARAGRPFAPQAREAAAARVPLLKDLRTIYAAATRHAAPAAAAAPGRGDARGGGDADSGGGRDQGPDFVSQPDPHALADALHRRVRQLVDEVEVQDAELRALQVSTRADAALHVHTFLHNRHAHLHACVPA